MPNPRVMEGYTPGVDDDPASYLEELQMFQAHSNLQAIPDDDDESETDSEPTTYHAGLGGADHNDEEEQALPSFSRTRIPSNNRGMHNRYSSSSSSLPPVPFATTHMRQHGTATTSRAAVVPEEGGERGMDTPEESSQHIIPHRKERRGRILLIILGVLFIMLLAVMIGTLVALRQDKSSRSSSSSSSNNFQAFVSRDELIQAVDRLLLQNDVSGVQATYGPIEMWQVEAISNFAQLFDARGRQPAAANFDADLSAWNVSRGVNFYAMFQDAKAFRSTRNLTLWDMGQAQDLSYAFAGATRFNADISNWDVRKVTSLQATFQGALEFNQDLSKWKLSSLTSLSSAFDGATNFNQDLCPWNTYISGPIPSLDSFRDTACPAADESLDWTSKPPGPFCHVCPPQYECFASRNDLLLAIDEFWIDPSLVAARYGPALENWCVERVTDFSHVLSAARNPALITFNRDVSSWNMGQAISLAHMFDGSVAFNQDLSSWDVSSVTNLDSFLNGATSFRQDLCIWRDQLKDSILAGTNAFDGTKCAARILTGEVACTWCVPAGSACFKDDDKELYTAVDRYLEEPSGVWTRTSYGHPIGTWCVGDVTNFDELFDDERNALATNFNEDIGSWDVSGAVSVFKMFSGAREFNQDLSFWNVENVVEFGGMFNNATKFNGDVSQWSTSNARFLYFMFNGATVFNQDVSLWDVSRVENFGSMFRECEVFNRDLSQWRVGNGIDFSFMFYRARSFEGVGLGNWDVSRATDMYAMLAEAMPFNSDIRGWNVARVTNLGGALAFLPLFNQDLSSWDVSRVTDMRLTFVRSESFQQDLCPWGSRLPSTTRFDRTFLGSKCANQEDPDLSADPPGPFCEPC